MHSLFLSQMLVQIKQSRLNSLPSIYRNLQSWRPVTGKQRKRIHVASNHRKSPCCFSKESRKEKPHWGRDVAVPPRSPGSSCSQDALQGCEATWWEGKLQWVEQGCHRPTSESVIWDTGLCLSTSVILLISCQFHLPGRDGEKWLLFLTNARKAILDPPRHFGFTYLSYQLHKSCAFYKDLLERQWLNEPVPDSGEAASTYSKRERQGQKKRVGPGDDRRKRDKASKIYT